MTFKICSQFSENAIIEKFVKILALKKYNFLSVFQSGAPRCSNAHSEVVEKLIKEDFDLEIKCVLEFFFFFFAPRTKNYQITI